MNTRTIFLFFLWLLFVGNEAIFAQSTYQFGLLPSVNFNKKLKNDWSLNNRLESRQLLQRGQINGPVQRAYSYVLTDFSIIAAKKIGLKSRGAAGYLIRFEDGEIQHRFIQQFTIVQNMPRFRLAHRIVTDQTISPSEEPDFRLRYRITSEIPLNGESVDPKEFYLRINNEYLNSIQASEYDLEIRVVPFLGYEINDKFKIETGLDYRVNSFIHNKTRHSYWMSINFFMEI